ncbi:Holliday junction resolvase MOC1, chloroplastic [Cyclospora cayetanensis]|uniref:Holliday junction resolvase MOC1, chloroplastic n=1 Tax=Cyclospora cayetanensis TaxID=88456 RepID=A0A6P6S115_9EIME|nr:Holliday junction resolvase MOC1, chloroplastic [Cyclospora cayetanensis]
MAGKRVAHGRSLAASQTRPTSLGSIKSVLPLRTPQDESRVCVLETLTAATASLDLRSYRAVARQSDGEGPLGRGDPLRNSATNSQKQRQPQEGRRLNGAAPRSSNSSHPGAALSSTVTASETPLGEALSGWAATSAGASASRVQTPVSLRSVRNKEVSLSPPRKKMNTRASRCQKGGTAFRHLSASAGSTVRAHTQATAAVGLPTTPHHKLRGLPHHTVQHRELGSRIAAAATPPGAAAKVHQRLRRPQLRQQTEGTQEAVCSAEAPQTAAQHTSFTACLQGDFETAALEPTPAAADSSAAAATASATSAPSKTPSAQSFVAATWEGPLYEAVERESAVAAPPAAAPDESAEAASGVLTCRSCTRALGAAATEETPRAALGAAMACAQSLSEGPPHSHGTLVGAGGASGRRHFAWALLPEGVQLLVCSLLDSQTIGALAAAGRAGRAAADHPLCWMLRCTRLLAPCFSATAARTADLPLGAPLKQRLRLRRKWTLRNQQLLCGRAEPARAEAAATIGETALATPPGGRPRAAACKDHVEADSPARLWESTFLRRKSSDSNGSATTSSESGSDERRPVVSQWEAWAAHTLNDEAYGFDYRRLLLDRNGWKPRSGSAPSWRRIKREANPAHVNTMDAR